MSEGELVLDAVEQNPRQFASLVARLPLGCLHCVASKLRKMRGSASERGSTKSPKTQPLQQTFATKSAGTGRPRNDANERNRTRVVIWTVLLFRR
jgi:hypothetical protein